MQFGTSPTGKIRQSVDAVPQFDNVCIVGNAGGDWQISHLGWTIVFNGTNIEHPKVINIANGGFAGCEAPFAVQSAGLTLTQCHHLAEDLGRVATKLSHQLGCWPSSGLTALVLMLEKGALVDVERMSLLPPLARAETLTANQYVPCMVHNWLGERRVVLEMLGNESIAKRVRWPEFYIEKDIKLEHPQAECPIESPSHDLVCDPFSLLAELADSQSSLPRQQRGTPAHRPSDDTPKAYSSELELLTQTQSIPLEIKQYQARVIDTLLSLPLQSWLLSAPQSALIDIETLFFNETPAHTATAWYLLDNEYAQHLDVLRQTLAYWAQVNSDVKAFF